MKRQGGKTYAQRSLFRLWSEYKYHIVFIPKYRKRMLYGRVKKHVEEEVKEMSRQRGNELVEAHLIPDRIHMCLNVSKHTAQA
jgi:putative transposase